MDYYELLGVGRDASTAEIKSAYRALVRTMHPDTGGTEGTFRLLRDAYETLQDPARRADYDRRHTGEQGGRAVATKARPRAAGRARGRGFGDDPRFVPPAPRPDPDTIEWWHEVYPAERVGDGTHPQPGHGPLVVVLAGLLWLLLPAVLPIELSAVLTVWLLVAACAAAVAAWLARRVLTTARAERAFLAEFGPGTVFGRAGSERDQWSERLTADLLAAYLTRLPGTRVFHGLAVPGSVFADVDHAVLRGRRLVLVESKAWLPGHYVTSDGRLWRNGRPFRGGATRLPDRVAAFQDLLPSVQVLGALVVYPSRDGELTAGGELGEPSPPMTPEDFVRLAGAWLATEHSTVDADAFRLVLGQVVSP